MPGEVKYLTEKQIKMQIYSQSTEEQTVCIRLVLQCKVIIVENSHFEYCVISACAHVGYCKKAYHLNKKKNYQKYVHKSSRYGWMTKVDIAEGARQQANRQWKDNILDKS